jgi:hypothetical protein
MNQRLRKPVDTALDFPDENPMPQTLAEYLLQNFVDIEGQICS